MPDSSVEIAVVGEVAQGEAELQVIEHLLDRLAPAAQGTWTALLNALLMEAEKRPVCEPVVQAIGQALYSVCRVGQAGPALEEAVSALVRAAELPTDGKPATSYDERGMMHYSLGLEAAKMVAYLRFDLGLSVLYVRRYLCKVGLHMPPEALLRCIASIEPIPPGFELRSGQQTRRRGRKAGI